MSYFPGDENKHHIEVFLAKCTDLGMPGLHKRGVDDEYRRGLDGSEYYG